MRQRPNVVSAWSKTPPHSDGFDTSQLTKIADGFKTVVLGFVAHSMLEEFFASVRLGVLDALLVDRAKRSSPQPIVTSKA